jgi:hypothetical protein
MSAAHRVPHGRVADAPEPTSEHASDPWDESDDADSRLRRRKAIEILLSSFPKPVVQAVLEVALVPESTDTDLERALMPVLHRFRPPAVSLAQARHEAVKAQAGIRHDGPIHLPADPNVDMLALQEPERAQLLDVQAAKATKSLAAAEDELVEAREARAGFADLHSADAGYATAAELTGGAWGCRAAALGWMALEVVALAVSIAPLGLADALNLTVPSWVVDAGTSTAVVAGITLAIRMSAGKAIEERILPLPMRVAMAGVAVVGLVLAALSRFSAALAVEDLSPSILAASSMAGALFAVVSLGPITLHTAALLGQADRAAALGAELRIYDNRVAVAERRVEGLHADIARPAIERGIARKTFFDADRELLRADTQWMRWANSTFVRSHNVYRLLCAITPRERAMIARAVLGGES